MWSKIKNETKSVFGLATGFGLDANVLSAYQFLAKNYQEGDKICLFGFSRGAYTVRVLAGFIHMVGLMKPEQVHLAGFALIAYKQSSTNDVSSIAYRFNDVLDTYRPSIEFMGCWDTVSSIIVPRADRLYLPSMIELPHVSENTSVKAFRHAMAIDERRTLFNLTHWKEGQLYKPVQTLSDEHAIQQDINQTWFAGAHSDIGGGGGYPESESGLAKISLKWMVDQAREYGIQFDESMASCVIEGENSVNSMQHYCKVDPLAKLHESLKGLWRIVEYIPKYAKRAGENTKSLHIPCGERRYIAEGSNIHPSVRQRQQKSDYNPSNLPLDNAN